MTGNGKKEPADKAERNNPEENEQQGGKILRFPVPETRPAQPDQPEPPSAA